MEAGVPSGSESVCLSRIRMQITMEPEEDHSARSAAGLRRALRAFHVSISERRKRVSPEKEIQTQFAFLDAIIERLAGDAQVVIDLGGRQQVLPSIELHVGPVKELPQIAAMEVLWNGVALAEGVAKEHAIDLFYRFLHAGVLYPLVFDIAGNQDQTATQPAAAELLQRRSGLFHPLPSWGQRTGQLPEAPGHGQQRRIDKLQVVFLEPACPDREVPFQIHSCAPPTVTTMMQEVFCQLTRWEAFPQGDKIGRHAGSWHPASVLASKRRRKPDLERRFATETEIGLWIAAKAERLAMTFVAPGAFLTSSPCCFCSGTRLRSEMVPIASGSQYFWQPAPAHQGGSLRMILALSHLLMKILLTKRGQETYPHATSLPRRDYWACDTLQSQPRSRPGRRALPALPADGVS